MDTIIELKPLGTIAPANPMNINSLLNAAAEEQSSTFYYDLPFHSEMASPERIETRQDFARSNATPGNSFTDHYNTTAILELFPVYQGVLLPPMKTEYAGYPSPTLSHSSFPPVKLSPRGYSSHVPDRIDRWRVDESDYSLTTSSPHPFMTGGVPQKGHHSPRRRTHRLCRSEREYTHGKSSTSCKPRPLKPKKITSNEAYTEEEVHWMRYKGVDLKIKWKEIAEIHFPRQFTRATSEGGITSRVYRDNDLPMLDEDGDIMRDAKGKLHTISGKVREREQGEAARAPHTFIGRYPWHALTYDWVSPEDKRQAAVIVARIESADSKKKLCRKHQYAVAFRELTRMKGLPKRSGRKFHSLSLPSAQVKVKVYLSPRPEV